MFWVYVSEDNKSRNKHLLYTYRQLPENPEDLNEQINLLPFLNCQLKFENQDVTDKESIFYFLSTESFMNNLNSGRFEEGFKKFIGTYCFSMDPKNLTQPSGVCNFSEIHNPELELEFLNNVTRGEIKIYAINYNVLQIKNGKGVLFHQLGKGIRSTLPKLKLIIKIIKNNQNNQNNQTNNQNN